MDFYQVGLLPEALLIAQRVDVQLRPSDVLGLSSLDGLEVDHDDLVRVCSLDEVDTSIDDDSARQDQLDGLLGVHELVHVWAVVPQIPLERLLSGTSEVFFEGRVCVADAQMHVEECWDKAVVD
jgi:hypothetical protein